MIPTTNVDSSGSSLVSRSSVSSRPTSSGENSSVRTLLASGERISSVGDTTEVAERIQKELALPFDVNGHEIFTDVSTGIAVYDGNYKQPEDAELKPCHVFYSFDSIDVAA